MFQPSVGGKYQRHIGLLLLQSLVVEIDIDDFRLAIQPIGFFQTGVFIVAGKCGRIAHQRQVGLTGQVADRFQLPFRGGLLGHRQGEGVLKPE